MKKPLPKDLSGRDIILMNARPDYQFWFNKAKDCDIKVLTFPKVMQGTTMILIPN